MSTKSSPQAIKPMQISFSCSNCNGKFTRPGILRFDNVDRVSLSNVSKLSGRSLNGFE